MAIRKMTFGPPEPLVSEALAARLLQERYAALVSACEMANQDPDLAEIEKEFNGLRDEMAERWE